MEKYTHTVKYYETDRMGFTHHSNYVRWMEEARIDFMDQLGWGYREFEDKGIISPVTSISCKYKHTTTFPDVVHIEIFVREFRGIKLKLEYVMTDDNGNVVCEAKSEHCFLDKDGKIVMIKREYPDFFDLLNKLVVE
ncbi:MAG: acyl-CoA thioesterase [Lachnospiraceae bacterium]|nr:acyl-CoA thioesterase [Lachnospiraceae bacterium]